VLLIQLVNQRFTEIQREDPTATTPFEAALFAKLYNAYQRQLNQPEVG
jgi:hypothetical protein